MKKIISIILALTLVLGSCLMVFAEETKNSSSSIAPISKNAVVYDINKNLSTQQIADRFQKINKSYKIGEQFSKADAEFIRAYAHSNSSDGIQTKAYTGDPEVVNVDKLGGSSSTVYGRLYGTITNKMGNINHTFGANLTATATSSKYTINKISIYANCIAYGLIGSSGIGKVYEKTLSTGGTTSPIKLSKTQLYTAAALYSNVTCWMDIKYNNGSLLTVTGY